MADSSVLSIHTDGASRGNPGAAAYAYVIAQDGTTLVEEAGCLGQMTNNQAEYTALVRSLEHALELGAHHRLLVHSDSELLVKQMKGEYRVKNEDLRDLYEEARRLSREFEGVSFTHVRRAQNSRADALCNEALDGLREPTPRLERPRVAPAVAPPSLHEQAVRCLRQAAAAWVKGDADLSAETVWEQLVELLRKRGVKVPEG
jgi:ribonuclease HI